MPKLTNKKAEVSYTISDLTADEMFLIRSALAFKVTNLAYRKTGELDTLMTRYDNLRLSLSETIAETVNGS